MGADHDRLDALFKHFQEQKEQQEEAKGSFHLFMRGLLRHIDWEEGILFPLFEERTGMAMGPTEVMRTEHASIKSTLKHIWRMLGENNFDTGHHEAKLLGVLSPHNLKEEQILYPMIDRALSPKEMAKTLGKLK